MKRIEAALAILLALSLAGCILRGKQPIAKAAPPPPKPVPAPAAPPPQPLSIPQTRVELPPPQPISAEALATTVPENETPLPPAPAKPVRRTPTAQTRPEPQPVVQTPAPVTPPAVEPGRPPIQEAVPAAEMKRLQDEADARRRDVRQRLEQFRPRNHQQQSLVDRILSFLKQSDEAQRRGDMRQASELAGRALVLAGELK